MKPSDLEASGEVRVRMLPKKLEQKLSESDDIHYV